MFHSYVCGAENAPPPSCIPLTCIKEWISLIAMLSYTVFVTVYIQVSLFSSNILMFIEQVHLLLLFTSKSRPLAPPTSGSTGVSARTLQGHILPEAETKTPELGPQISYVG